jgi:hypothetical protein
MVVPYADNHVLFALGQLVGLRVTCPQVSSCDSRGPLVAYRSMFQKFSDQLERGRLDYSSLCHWRLRSSPAALIRIP